MLGQWDVALRHPWLSFNFAAIYDFSAIHEQAGRNRAVHAGGSCGRVMRTGHTYGPYVRAMNQY